MEAIAREKKKMDISWATSKGTATVSMQLRTEKASDADGDKISVSCCETEIVARVEVLGIVGTGAPWTRPGLPAGIVATIGRLAITQENLDRINHARACLAESPEWQAKLARAARVETEGREYDAHRSMMRKVMGY